jgi:DNA invertase Pin-like site-specific DNA recombinase
MDVAILTRVSSNKQEDARQESELRNVCQENNWAVVECVSITLSGNSKERPDLERVMTLARDGKIQKVLVHEVSRVARRNSTAHKFVEDLAELGVSLWWNAQRIETLLPDGKRNPAAAIMFALLAEMARAEREQLIERTRSGLAEARRNGQVLGRPVGFRLDALKAHPDVVRMLRANKSIRDCALRCGCSPMTVQRVKRAMDATPAEAEK